MNSLRILMAANRIYPDRTGGSERVISDLGKRMVDAGNEVTILGGSEDLDKRPMFEMREGVRIVRYRRSEANQVLSNWSVLYCLRAATSLFRRYSFDVINIHQPLCGLGVRLAALTHGYPTVMTIHSPEHIEFLLDMFPQNYMGLKEFVKPIYVKLYSRWLKAVESWHLRRCDGVVCLSSYMKDMITNLYGISSERIVVIPHNVDTQKFCPGNNTMMERRLLNIPDDRWVLLTVRRLEFRMGVDNLIQAMSTVRRFIPESLLLIVGKGSLEGQLKELVSRLDLGRWVRFEGFIDEEKLPSYYRTSDLFVLPTRNLEGFGLITLEALSSGTPVVATPVGANLENLENFDLDLLANGTDPKSIAEVILRFYKTQSGKEDVRIRCRRHVLKNYRWESILQDYEAAFEQAIVSKSRSPRLKNR